MVQCWEGENKGVEAIFLHRVVDSVFDGSLVSTARGNRIFRTYTRSYLRKLHREVPNTPVMYYMTGTHPNAIRLRCAWRV